MEPVSQNASRRTWLQTMHRVAEPVLRALSRRELKLRMPVEAANPAGNALSAHLEAFGRTLCGVAPWLECPDLTGEEDALRQEWCVLAREALDAATDPDSADFLNFSHGQQPIVDMGFLSHAILRAPRELGTALPARVRQNLCTALKTTRTRKPAFCNWLLFAAITEAALRTLGEEWDAMRVDFALKQHLQWYVGDGVFGDGPQFHWDYYNSFVIQPMLADILHATADAFPDWQELTPRIRQINQRYAEILERLIAPDGSFPPIGRSLAYRCGAFQHLAQMALQHQLPPALSPAQVREALTAVLRRTLDAPGTFDDNGWLQTGLCGHQPSLGEPYICTGSLYLCAAVFLPLGLPPQDAFWKDSPQPWTQQRIWSGQDLPCDHAY